MSAIALAGAMGFTACSSDDDTMQNVNPSYDGKSVKTQFAINVPRAAQTRQTEVITQNDGNFRGIEEIKLIPFKGNATTGESIIELTNLDGSNTTNYKLYNDVEIAVDVTSFLFYGQATGTKEAAASTSIADKHTNGVLNKNIDENYENTEISLQKIYSTTLDNTNLLKYLNDILAADGDWKADVGTSTTHLGQLFNSFTSLTAGSSTSILKAVERLYNGVALPAYANNDIAVNIKNKIAEYFTVTTNTNNDDDDDLSNDDDLRSYTLAYKSSSEEIINFPNNLGLPEGAARLTYNNNNNGKREFRYATTALGPTENNAINAIAINSICYPAALNYFANTSLKAANDEMTEWPKTTSDWTSYEWTGWGDKVLPTTRTIALKENINYGVALLQTTVKTAATLKDNSNSKGGASADQEFIIGSATDELKLTGVLVGGQPNVAKWDFTPVSTLAPSFANTIWDCTMNGNIYANNTNTNPTPANYTMVLDNTANGAEKVNIAIELENNLGDFYGVDGLVPEGSKFYLVAQLDPTATTTTKPAGTNISQVFLKDYTTIANLTITSLKNAYVTIPDLRSSKLQLGLSVDLAWQTGLTFNVEI